MTIPTLRLTKRLSAPPEDVFDMWLDQEQMRRWMCPGNTTVAAIKLDPVEGGAFQINMQTPDGEVYVHSGQFLEICRPERLVFSWRSSATDDRATRVTIELSRVGAECELVLIHEQLPHEASADAHRAGWTDILGLLADNVHSGRE